MKYVDEDALYDIMASCQSDVPESERLSSMEAMKRLNQLIKRIKSHGSWRFICGKLEYHPNFQAIADSVETTSSVIMMPSGAGNRKSRTEVECNEFDVEMGVAREIERFYNRSFRKYGKPEWAELYYLRHIYGMTIRDIRRRYSVSNREIYKWLDLAEYVVTYGFCLYEVDRIYNMYADLVKRYRAKCGLPMNYWREGDDCG